jgi:hypothetical protein
MGRHAERETTMTTINQIWKVSAGIAAFLVAGTLAVGAVGCGDDSGNGMPDLSMKPKADLAVSMGDMANNGSTDMAEAKDADCFDNPMTHEQIINACTTATRLPKNPTLPLLNKDGTLPPLP